MMKASILAVCCLLSPSFAQAATIVSHRTGATAQVSGSYAGRFQGYINELEARGAAIRFMGGWRRGRCSSGHQHPCGMALDVCQTGRDHVAASCHLPSRHELARIAASHGLWEGGQWCHGDYGHVQVQPSAGTCSFAWSARSHHRHHHHRHRY